MIARKFSTMDRQETIQLALGGSATGSLRALTRDRRGDRVVCLDEHFAIGPLLHVDSPDGRLERKKYLKRLCERILMPELYEWAAPNIGLPILAQQPPIHAQVIVWFGPNADE